MRRNVWIALALALTLAGCRGETVEIPAQSMIVKHGGTEGKDIVAVFPQSTRLAASDRRLAEGDVLPYWRWDFQVGRELQEFNYTVSLSIMGSPEEGLKYRDKAKAGWHRQELEAWSQNMLGRFEANLRKTWAPRGTPPTEAEREDFKQKLKSWFQQSEFANQGIHIEQVAIAQ